jgi:PAS domain S-box-containing protein
MSEERSVLSEAAFRLMVENSQDITAICDVDSRIRYSSPSAREVLGYEQEEILGSAGFDFIHPEDRASAVATLNQFVKTPGARDSIQYRTRHADGSWVSLEVVATNMLDHPVIRGVVINGRDVGKRKPAETEHEHTIAGLAGVLPICSSCKKIRDEGGDWEDVEVYIRDHASVEFSHGMCPDCAKRLYPEVFEK